MNTWRLCSSCKQSIAYGQRYKICSVSTCNRPRTSLVFCSTACWDSHVPVVNHRDAWCEEVRAPLVADPSSVQAGSVPAGSPPPGSDVAVGRRRVIASPIPEPSTDDVLIVASRLKQYIHDRAEMNTSADVLEALSDLVRAHTDVAIQRARADGRKTVKGRDFGRE